MQKLCKQCGKEFEAIRITALYCSSPCRKLAFQKEVSVPEVSVPEVSVPGDEISVQPTPDISTPNIPKTNPGQVKSDNPGQTQEIQREKYPEGHCQGCGEKQPNKNCEICEKCIKAGLTREKLNLPDIEMETFTDDKFIPNYKKTKDLNGEKKEKWTHTEAIERAIHAIASIGCDCIVGNKIYESSKVLRVKI